MSENNTFQNDLLELMVPPFELDLLIPNNHGLTIKLNELIHKYNQLVMWLTNFVNVNMTPYPMDIVDAEVEGDPNDNNPAPIVRL